MLDVKVIRIAFSHEQGLSLKELNCDSRNIRKCEHCGHTALVNTPFLYVRSDNKSAYFISSRHLSIIENIQSREQYLSYINEQVPPDEAEELSTKFDEQLLSGELDLASWVNLSAEEVFKRSKGLAAARVLENRSTIERVMSYHNLMYRNDISVPLTEAEFTPFFCQGIIYCIKNLKNLLDVKNEYGDYIYELVDFFFTCFAPLKRALKLEETDDFDNFVSQLNPEANNPELIPELLEALLLTIPKKEFGEYHIGLHNLLENTREQPELDFSNVFAMLSIIISYYQEIEKPAWALCYSEQLARLSYEYDDARGQAAACYNMGVSNKQLEVFPKALVHFRFAAEKARESDHAWLYGLSFKELAIAEAEEGHLDYSINYINEAIHAFKADEKWTNEIVS